MSYDVCEVTERLENEHSSQLYSQQSSFSNLFITSPTSQLIFQPFCHFTYVTAHSPTRLCLQSQQSSFSNLFITSPTSQLILQPFRRFTYVTAHCPTLPLLHLRHSSFPNPSSSSPTSQALHLNHLASRPCCPCIIIRMLVGKEKDQKLHIIINIIIPFT